VGTATPGGRPKPWVTSRPAGIRHGNPRTEPWPWVTSRPAASPWVTSSPWVTTFKPTPFTTPATPGGRPKPWVTSRPAGIRHGNPRTEPWPWVTSRPAASPWVTSSPWEWARQATGSGWGGSLLRGVGSPSSRGSQRSNPKKFQRRQKFWCGRNPKKFQRREKFSCGRKPKKFSDRKFVCFRRKSQRANSKRESREKREQREEEREKISEEMRGKRNFRIKIRWWYGRVRQKKLIFYCLQSVQ
jgi:hypothetical protein